MNDNRFRKSICCHTAIIAFFLVFHGIAPIKLEIMISNSTINLIRDFVSARDWDQFHTPGNLAKSVSIEAAELLECFQWSDEPRNDDLEHVHEEIADVLIYSIMLSNKLGFDLDEIILDKLSKNARKYPVEISRGNSKKAS